MGDRELLEMAAKAAGILSAIVWSDWPNPDPICWIRTPLPCGSNDDYPWNPIEDDGDAFRLAGGLEFAVDFGAGIIICGEDIGSEIEFENPSDLSNVRHAIVLAAAEIGRSMP